MNQSCKGFILVATLLMLFVFALLIATGIQQTGLYLKLINREEENHQKFYSMEYLAEQIVNNGHSALNSKCISRHHLSSKEIIHVLLNSTCVLQIGDRRFNYFIEDLGDFPCLVISKGEVNYVSHHFRLTITYGKTENSNELLLQLRYFTVSRLSECKTEVEKVSEGISTWRYFLL
ncbi:hypothetical protein [Legionella waltersii]|uniref:Tfp pilus assembly protein PilX n=1 Tax=Legionella waltersii TaxID=66969 RepID=A0A0W1AP49_9GAMM|nr:hypothetical protein [Legionella waltersii]KTD83026.1 hypothetical protein Lwal_0142 [Legionella waltersii]SNV07719.1 Uncharacterised protein [Legionella waltersii]